MPHLITRGPRAQPVDIGGQHGRTLVGVSIRVNGSLEVPDDELQVSFSRSGGPGGQHANKASTRVEIRWNIAESAVVSERQRSRLVERFGETLRIVVDDERSQLRNRELAEERFAARVRGALVVERPRVPTRRTRSSQRRRLDAKKRTGDQKRLRRKPGRDD